MALPFTRRSASRRQLPTNAAYDGRMPHAFILLAALSAASWIPQSSPTQASLRGLAVVSPQVIWASGTDGTWLMTGDGGGHWRTGSVPGAEKLDFRDVEAWDARHAILLSSGEGENSRIYQTNSGGENWELLFTTPDPKGFFDALSFWDRQHGILLGDPVDGHFVILRTMDGGKSWRTQNTPSALAGEGAFAASGTSLAVYGAQDVWFGRAGRLRRAYSTPVTAGGTGRRLLCRSEPSRPRQESSRLCLRTVNTGLRWAGTINYQTNSRGAWL